MSNADRTFEKSHLENNRDADMDRLLHDLSSELRDLRERNAQLLERVTDLRSRNNELAKSDELSREKDRSLELLRDAEALLSREVQKLQTGCEERDAQAERLRATISEREGDLKRLGFNETQLVREASELRAEMVRLKQELLDARKEADNLRTSLSHQEGEIKHIRNSYDRKLAQIADQSWAKDLEINRLTESQAALETELSDLRARVSAQNRFAADANSTISELREAVTLREQRIEQAFESVRAETEALRAEHASEMSVVRTERDTLASEHARVLGEKSDLEHALESADERIAELMATVETKTRSELEARIAHERFEAEAKSAQERLLAEALTTQERLTTEARVTRERLTTDLQNLLAERESLSAALTEAKALGLRQAETISERSARVEALDRALYQQEADRKVDQERFRIIEAGMKAHAARLDERVETLEAELAEATSEVSRLERAAEGWSAKCESQERRLRDLETAAALAADRAKTTEETARDQIAAAKAEANVEARMRGAAEAKIRTLEKTIEELGAEIRSVRTQAEERHYELGKTHTREIEAQQARETTLRQEIVTVQAERFEAERRAREAQDAIANLKTLVEIQKREFAEMKEDLTDANVKLKAQVAAAETSALEFQRSLESKESRVDEQTLEIAARLAQVEQREQQMRHYVSSVSRDKSDVLRICRELETEIKLAKTNHPLNDYLKVTEFELSKLEVELKKTPVLAPERPKLEDALKKMVEQRDFLKSVLASARKQLETQAATLEKIANGGRLAPIPPPPPSAMAARPAAPGTKETNELPIRWENAARDLA